MDLAPRRLRLIQALNQSKPKGVFVLSGGGSEALGELLKHGGGSETLISALVPYHRSTIDRYLGRSPAQACSGATARALALQAYHDACVDLDPAPNRLFGAACTASLLKIPTERTGRQHRVHLAVQGHDQTWHEYLAMRSGRTREEEESLCSDLLLNLVAKFCGVSEDLLLPVALTAEEELATRVEVATSDLSELVSSHRGLLCINNAHALPPKLVLSGSFNPCHDGHREILAISKDRTGLDPAVELSVVNADKPTCDYIDLVDRVASINAVCGPNIDIWAGTCPTFIEKARFWGGNLIFAVGMDTALRIGQERFYGGQAQMVEVMAEFSQLNVRFLVFYRETSQPGDLEPGFREICEIVPQREFDNAISSTKIRNDHS